MSFTARRVRALVLGSVLMCVLLSIGLVGLRPATPGGSGAPPVVLQGRVEPLVSADGHVAASFGSQDGGWIELTHPARPGQAIRIPLRDFLDAATLAGLPHCRCFKNEVGWQHLYQAHFDGHVLHLVRTDGGPRVQIDGDSGAILSPPSS